MGRFFSAAFLAAWLCGWVIGESFAVYSLLAGAHSLVTGRPLSPGAGPPELAPALFAGLFLVFWLSLWTLGGFMAAHEALRLLSSEDRIVARPDALVIHRRLGPFRSTRTIPRSALLRIYSLARKCRLMAETPDGPIPMTSLAPGGECESLAMAFHQEMGLKPRDLQDPASPPERWREVIDAEGSPALVENEDQRRVQGRIAWVVTAIFAGVAAPLLRYSGGHRGMLPVAAVLGAATVALAWASWRLTHTRLEWRIDSGCLRLRRRSDSGVRDLFEGVSLELVRTSDSDGDPWFTLNVLAAGAPPHQDPPRLSNVRMRRKLAHEMDDPTMPSRLGAWLAARSGIPLDDRTTTEAGEKELAALISRLESGGRFSRWLARQVPRTPR